MRLICERGAAGQDQADGSVQNIMREDSRFGTRSGGFLMRLCTVSFLRSQDGLSMSQYFSTVHERGDWLP